MTTSAIILNYNSADDTLKLASTIASYFDHIIVVDNASTDNSRYMLSSAQSPEFSLILNSVNVGYARGNNIGFLRAIELGCNYAFVLNPDVEVDGVEVVEEIVRQLKTREVVACGPMINTIAPYSCRPNVVSFLFPPLHRLVEQVLFRVRRNKNIGVYTVYKLYGCFVGFDLGLMRQVGFFDERTFLYFEESILAEKFYRNGFVSLMLPNKSVRHYTQGSVRKLGSSQFIFFYRSCFIYLKHHRFLPSFIAAPLSLIDVLWRFFLNQIRGMV